MFNRKTTVKPISSKPQVSQEEVRERKPHVWACATKTDETVLRVFETEEEAQRWIDADFTYCKVLPLYK